jgi:hypothetical protein
VFGSRHYLRATFLYQGVISRNEKPTTVWRKSEIISWLGTKRVSPTRLSDFRLSNCKYLDAYKEAQSRPKYVVEEMIEKCGKDIKLLWLPQLFTANWTQLELVWAHVKGEVSRSNKTFKIKDVLPLCQKTLASVPVDLWSKCVQHVIKLEDEVMKRERIAEGYIGELRHKIIVTLTESDSESSDSSSSYDSDGSEV